jgi:hypothetical protein
MSKFISNNTKQINKFGSFHRPPITKIQTFPSIINDPIIDDPVVIDSPIVEEPVIDNSIDDSRDEVLLENIYPNKIEIIPIDAVETTKPAIPFNVVRPNPLLRRSKSLNWK